SVRPSSRRVRLLGFFSMMWRRLACWRTSLPVPVFRKRLAVPLWVFIFGMIASSSHGSSRMTRWGLGGADAVRPVVCRCPPGGLSGVLVRDLGALRLRPGLGATVGRHDHGHVAAVLLGAGLDVPGLGDVVRQSLEEPEPELGPRLLTATEHDRHLDLGALLQETDDVPLLGLVVMRVDLGPELLLLDHGLLLVLPGLALFLRLLVLELAVVHDLGDRRARVRRDLDQVQVGLQGQSKSILDANDPDLLAPGADESDFGDTASFVDTCFGADGRSSVDSMLCRDRQRGRASILEGPLGNRRPLRRKPRRPRGACTRGLSLLTRRRRHLRLTSKATSSKVVTIKLPRCESPSASDGGRSGSSWTSEPMS